MLSYYLITSIFFFVKSANPTGYIRRERMYIMTQLYEGDTLLAMAALAKKEGWSKTRFATFAGIRNSNYCWPSDA